MRSLPNILTIGRIVAIPLFAAVFFIPGPAGAWVAFAVFVAAAVTDFVDGWLARRWQVTSAFGIMLDPIADKMLVAATLLLLCGFDRIDPIHQLAALIILMREIFISGLREFLAGRQATGLPVSALAKWKTAIQMVASAILILWPGLPMVSWMQTVGSIGLWLAAGLTVWTAWGYTTEGLRQIQASDQR